MAEIVQDLRFSFRFLRKQPFFTAVVTFTLAVGIGANVAVFSVVRGVLLRPLPYGNGDRVTLLWGSNPERGWLRFGASLQDFEDWRAQSRTFEHVAAYWSGQANLTGGDRPERVSYSMVSPSIFSVLGTAPELGRVLSPEENLPGNDDGIVVSFEFWQRVLGGRPDVLGVSVSLDGRPLEVVGVMPRGFRFPSPDVELWKPFGGRPDEFGGRGARWVGVVGALAPGRTLAEADAEMEAIAQRLEAAYPSSNTSWRVFLEPFRQGLVRNVRPALVIAWGAVGLVLLITCANVANLLLARSTRRERELALRAAIGAGRPRLIRQLLTEGLLLSALGAALGLALAAVGLIGLSRLAPAGMPRVSDIGIDAWVLLYSIGLVAVAGILFGVLPAYRATTGSLSESLKEGTRGTEGVRHRRVRGGLMVAELALAVVVLIGAGLMVRSFARLVSVDPGFDYDRQLTMRVAPSMATYQEREQAVAFYDQLIERLTATPGAVSVAAINVLPVSGNWWSASFWKEGTAPLPDEQPVGRVRVISGPYFAAMGIPLVRGRPLQDSDDANAQPVVVIDRLAAEQFWPGEDPIGQRISFSNPSTPRDEPARWYTVVGISGAVRHSSMESAPTPMVYMTLPQAQFGHFQDWGMSLVLQTEGDPLGLAQTARSALAELVPELPVYQIRSLERVVANDVAPERFTMTLLGIFGVVALVLSAVGVYGVLSYNVAERTREIGMRMALGADRTRILVWVVSRGMVLAAAGLGLGVVSAIAATRLMSGLLFEISETDPATFAGITILLGVVALAGCAVPALRATRIDPMVALRES